MNGWMRSVGRWVGACLVAAAVAACTAGGTPRARLGSLPFPGLFTLYSAPDPDRLGVHCREFKLENFGRAPETDRGTLYTRRAGFLDLCHLRDSADWVKFLHGRVRRAWVDMEESGAPRARFGFTNSQASVEVTITRPGWWGELGDDERSAVIEEASIRAAQRLSVVVSTWHEAATWYGYETVPGISERQSAFTWDDTAAHVVAATVGGRALRDEERDWDLAVTHALSEELRELEVVSRQEQSHAVELVKGRWWKGGDPIRRDLDTGLAGPKRAWLAPGMGGEAAALVLPTLEDVYGRDCRAVIGVRIAPHGGVAKRMGSARGAAMEGETGLLEVVERVRGEVRAKWGPEADQP